MVANYRALMGLSIAKLRKVHKYDLNQQTLYILSMVVIYGHEKHFCIEHDYGKHF